MLINLLFCLATPAVASAPTGLTEAAEVLPDGGDAAGRVVAKKWKNGTVIVVEDHRVPLVSIELSFHTGKRDRWWYANDLDYLWPTIIQPELESERDPRFRSWGANYSCGLSFTTQPQNLSELMDLVHERLVTEYEDYQHKIRRALARRYWSLQLASPNFVMDQAITRAYFQATDPRRMAYETPEFKPTKEIDLVALRDTVVGADGWVWSFAGDIDVSTALAAVERTLPSSLSQGKKTEDGPASFPNLLAAQGNTTTLGLPGIDEVISALTRPGLRLADPWADASVLADAVVVRRLEGVVRHGRGDSYAFATDGLLAVAPEVYVMTSMTSPTRVDAHRKAVLDELARIAAEGLSVDEIERARRVMRMAELRTSQAPHERALLWVRDHLRSQIAPGSESLGGRVLEASAERVSAFAQEFYAPAAFAEFALGPTDWARSEIAAQQAAAKLAGASATFPSPNAVDAAHP